MFWQGQEAEVDWRWGALDRSGVLEWSVDGIFEECGGWDWWGYRFGMADEALMIGGVFILIQYSRFYEKYTEIWRENLENSTKIQKLIENLKNSTKI